MIRKHFMNKLKRMVIIIFLIFLYSQMITVYFLWIDYNQIGILIISFNFFIIFSIIYIRNLRIKINQLKKS
jgi:hypothetical protein